MLINILSPVFLGLITVLTVVIEHFWRDKRTKRYKITRKILFGAIVIAVILNVTLVVNNERTINKRDSSIESLKAQVATLEKQNKMLSILERMQCYITSDYDELSKKYPEGYYLFASNKYTVIPSNPDEKAIFSLDWNTCKVAKITDSFLHIVLKSFTFLPNNIDIQNLNIVLERKVGSIADGIYMNNIGLFVELIDQRNDEIIYVIGFKKIDSIPKIRTLDSRVMAFISDNHIPRAKSALDTNIRKYIRIIDWTISSGWKVEAN